MRRYAIQLLASGICIVSIAALFAVRILAFSEPSLVEAAIWLLGVFAAFVSMLYSGWYLVIVYDCDDLFAALKKEES